MDLKSRAPGPDVVRALAMAGVVMMNYHGYLIIRGAQRDGGVMYDLFDPWTGPLSTRFAATFVLTAGVGVTLMTRSAMGERVRTTEMRWRLVRRGLLLYGGGLLFDFIWAGTILPFYGAMFVIAAALFTLATRWIAMVGLAAALAGWGIRWWVFERTTAGESTAWVTNPGDRSPRGLVFDVLVNGTHPLLPWLAFFCAGIIVGRMLSEARWRPSVAGFGIALYAVARVATSFDGSVRVEVVLSDDPFDRGIVYVASALGTALIAFAAMSWLADRFTGRGSIDALQRVGQMSLTIYVGHALVFNFLVDWIDVFTPSDVSTALLFATSYWLLASAVAIAYHHRFGQGPVERLYRKLS